MPIDYGTNDLLSSGLLTIASGNWVSRISATGASFSGLIFSPTGNFTTLRQNGTGVSISGHTHTVANITDFNTGVSGSLNTLINTTISGGAGINVLYYDNINTLLFSTTGVALLDHGHTSSQITANGNWSAGNYKITNLGTPTVSGDAVNKNYIDTLYASTLSAGIASFSSNNFDVNNTGLVTVKNSGINNNQLLYSKITLGTTDISLGDNKNKISGLTMDGGSP